MLWLLAMLLLAPSCRQDRDVQEFLNEEEFVDLNLEINASNEEGESDDLRSEGVYVYRDRQDKLKVDFRRHDGGETRTITTVVMNGDQEIFREDLEWKISNQNNRLTYQGPLRIKKEYLENPQKLIVYAYMYAYHEWNPSPKISYTHQGESNGKYLRIPFFMGVEVEQQGKKLVVKDHANAKFRPKGYLVRLHIKNSLPSQVVISAIGAGMEFPSFTGYYYLDDGSLGYIARPNPNQPGVDYIAQESYGTQDDDKHVVYSSIQIPSGSKVEYIFWATDKDIFDHVDKSPLSPEYFPVFGQTLGVAKRRGNDPARDGMVVHYDLEYKLSNDFNPNINGVRPAGRLEQDLSNTFYLIDFNWPGHVFWGKDGERMYVPMPYENVQEPDIRFRMWYNYDKPVSGLQGNIPIHRQLSYYIPYFGPLNNWPQGRPTFQFVNRMITNDPYDWKSNPTYSMVESVLVGNVEVQGSSVFVLGGRQLAGQDTPEDPVDDVYDAHSGVYAIRLKNTPYRVFQRWTVYGAYGQAFYGVSFLKYDASAVNEHDLINSPVFTTEYWSANRSKIQTILFPAIAVSHVDESELTSLTGGRKIYSKPFDARIIGRIFLRSQNGPIVTMGWTSFGPDGDNDNDLGVSSTPLYGFQHNTPISSGYTDMSIYISD